ncbi:unnamed protein product [Sympodiomycopsis kandeliae]
MVELISSAIRQATWAWSHFQDEQARHLTSSKPSSAAPPLSEDVIAEDLVANATRPAPTSNRFGLKSRRSLAASVELAQGGNGMLGNSGEESEDDGTMQFLTFWVSRYGATALIMGVLINRIRHICRPRGRPVPLPNWKRYLIRLPALIALAVCSTLLAFRSLQAWTAQRAPGESRVADFVAARTDVLWSEKRLELDATLLWRTYLSTCVAVATDALVRTLEGTHDPVSPFNLLGFALTVQAHRLEPHWVQDNYFLFVCFQVAELFALSLMNTIKPRGGYFRRLPITTTFGVLDTLHYLLAPSHKQPAIFGFNRLPDIIAILIIVGTIFLHAFTMLITEGKIDLSRLTFSSSNLPSMDDDYSLALFKLGAACMQSTRQAGLSRELTSVTIPEKTYVEIDESSNTTLKLGLDDLLNPQARASGLNKEVRITTPNTQRRAERYEAVFLPSSAKWREVKNFFFAFVSVLGRIWRAFASCLPNIPLPAWVHRLPRNARLLWHGQNGEERRERNIAQRNSEMEKRRQEARQLEGILSSIRGAGGSASTTAYEIRNNAIHRLETANATSSQTIADAAIATEDEGEEEDDEEWLESDEEEYEARRRARSVSLTPTPDSFGLRSRRSRSRSVMSPFSAVDEGDEEDDLVLNPDELADESVGLVHAARRDFDDDDYASSHQNDTGDRFNRVLLAHISSPSDKPLTRSRFRALVHQSPAPPATTQEPPSFIFGSPCSAVSTSLSSTPSDSDAHLKEVILRRRREVLRLSENQEDADKIANRDAMRTCVVCCFEERTIICWPCRCLALCDGCREELASRPSSSSPASTSYGGLHDCPTCRSKVQGFSRVYMP